MPKLYKKYLTTEARRVAVDIIHHNSYYAFFGNAVVVTQSACMRNLTNGKFKESFFGALKAAPNVWYNSLKMWPWVNYISFYYFPLQQRVLVNNVCSVVWATFLSWKQ